MGHFLVTTALLMTVLATCSCTTFYIVPVNSTERCEAEPCLTLDQLAGGIMNRYYNNLTVNLCFLPGEHILNRYFNIESVDSVRMIGSHSAALLLRNMLELYWIRELMVTNLTFVSSTDNEQEWRINIFQSGNVLFNKCVFWKVMLWVSSNSTTVTKCRLRNMYDLYPYIAVELRTNYLYISNCEFDGIVFAPVFNSFRIVFNYLLYISDSTFKKSRGRSGGAVNIEPVMNGLIYITSCQFMENHADDSGGALYIAGAANITIFGSIFVRNDAEHGGAINVPRNNYLEITNCTFTANSAWGGIEWSGGAIFTNSFDTKLLGVVVIRNTVFTSNFGTGAATFFRNRVSIENTTFVDNQADNHRVLTVLQSTLIFEHIIFNGNRGSVYSFSSRVDMIGPVSLHGNTGGAIHAVQSQIYINSTKSVSSVNGASRGLTVIRNNTASIGGGVLLRESELVIASPVTISENRAEMFGGGVYSYQSLLLFTSGEGTAKYFINNNFAGQNGGGVYAVASTIKLMRSYVTIGSNTALHNGGGLYLQENSRIYLLKEVDQWDLSDPNIQLEVSTNSAINGGGVFVADSSAGALQCQGEPEHKHGDAASVSPDCFIQTIRLYQRSSYYYRNTIILNNTAKLGSALYGGLLDRCTVSPLAEAYSDGLSGLQYFEMTVAISSSSSIASDPVQVFFCDQLDQSTITVRKGETFKITVSAIDQVENPVSATVHSSVVTESGVGRLKEGQAIQRVGSHCTELEYSVFSQDSSAQVELYADGPCGSLGISKQTFNVSFQPCTCPVGFQQSQSLIECECVCDQRLLPNHISNCSQEAGTIQLETEIWIGVANSSNGTGYVIHRCPFDYCVGRPVNISLNSSQERDRQCAFNRTGVLCGECQHGLSLVLATSNCEECSNIYLFLLIPFALAGIALVGFILFFNITIATGTIHSLIFYSNLLSANYFTQPSALTVFISWVNLDLGIETCFYDRMNSQVKVFLQLIFPAYLFLLMLLIIIISRYCNFFATLLSNRNPVAALCTLIFLSYSKLLRFIIAALQSTVLEFPDGSKQRVWSYNANVQYFTSSHTPLFVAAVLILTAGGLFTLQLFFAQWFPHCSKWKLMRWTRNTKYTGFMDAYHAPFVRKHRYWLGLLLFALIVHNVIAAIATDDFLPVLFMGCIGISLLMLKVHTRRVFKNWVHDLLENLFLLNLVFLANGTLYANTTKAAITALVETSIALSAGLFLLIICYHSYKHVFLQSRFYRRHRSHIRELTATVKENLECLKRREVAELVTDQRNTLKTHYTALKSHRRREPDLDVLAPITTDDYRPAPPPRKSTPEVTHTVVERDADIILTDTL